ncbi:unnamed protein product [Closterium sp. NIES-64]|nr:unnamed protein product [Closterium sp. NIES-64]
MLRTHSVFPSEERSPFRTECAGGRGAAAPRAAVRHEAVGRAGEERSAHEEQQVVLHPIVIHEVPAVWKAFLLSSVLILGQSTAARGRGCVRRAQEGMRTACTGRGCVRSAQGGDAYGAQGGDAYGAHREENG